MTCRSTVYFMYHELQVPGRDLSRNQSDYTRYAVAESDFRAQLSRLKEGGWRGMSVSEALAGSDRNRLGVVITFDDGCETDFTAAAPPLKEAGFNATFYIVAGHLGQRGYLSEAQLRQLADLDFEIGCHSMTHAYLTDLDPMELHAEIAESKERLEQVIGRRVEHFSCPGGRWSPRVAQVAREAGYHSVATSRIATNSIKTDPFDLARVVVMRGTSLAAFARLCRGHGLWRLQLRSAIRDTAKRVLGNSAYDRIRGLWLERSPRPGTEKVTPEPRSERHG